LAQFDEHIQQAKHNLRFLEFANPSGSIYYDWQVTICFYTALHLVNAHLSLFNMQYRKHVDVKDALNPKNAQSIATGSALPDNEYLAYMKLQSLSRRSRYLVNEKDGNIASQQAFITHDIHLNKSLKHLNTLINFFSRKYNLSFPKIAITCIGIGQGDLVFSK
jgi:hypothetical protein